jgi:hypothetical protein
VYIGGFGTGDMVNFLESNDKYNRLKQIIKTNYIQMVKNIDTKITIFISIKSTKTTFVNF